jgi:hypothetical protein
MGAVKKEVSVVEFSHQRGLYLEEEYLLSVYDKHGDAITTWLTKVQSEQLADLIKGVLDGTYK